MGGGGCPKKNFPEKMLKLGPLKKFVPSHRQALGGPAPQAQITAN